MSELFDLWDSFYADGLQGFDTRLDLEIVLRDYAIFCGRDLSEHERSLFSYLLERCNFACALGLRDSVAL